MLKQKNFLSKNKNLFREKREVFLSEFEAYKESHDHTEEEAPKDKAPALENIKWNTFTGRDDFDYIDSFHGMEKVQTLRQEIGISKEDAVGLIRRRVEGPSDNRRYLSRDDAWSLLYEKNEDFLKSKLIDSNAVENAPWYTPKKSVMTNPENYNQEFSNLVNDFFKALSEVKKPKDLDKTYEIYEKVDDLDYEFTPEIPGSRSGDLVIPIESLSAIEQPEGTLPKEVKLKGTLIENGNNLILETYIAGTKYTITLVEKGQTLTANPQIGGNQLIYTLDGNIVKKQETTDGKTQRSVTQEDFHDNPTNPESASESIKEKWESLSTEDKALFVITFIADLNNDKTISTRDIREEDFDFFFDLFTISQGSAIKNRALYGKDISIQIAGMESAEEDATRLAAGVSLTEKNIRTILVQLLQKTDDKTSFVIDEAKLNALWDYLCEGLPSDTEADFKNGNFLNNFNNLVKHFRQKLRDIAPSQIERETLGDTFYGRLERQINQKEIENKEQEVKTITDLLLVGFTDFESVFGTDANFEKALKEKQDSILGELNAEDKEKVRYYPEALTLILERYISAYGVIEKAKEMKTASGQDSIDLTEEEKSAIFTAFKEGNVEGLAVGFRLPPLAEIIPKIKEGLKITGHFDYFYEEAPEVTITKNTVTTTRRVIIQDPTKGEIPPGVIVTEKYVNGVLQETTTTPLMEADGRLVEDANKPPQTTTETYTTREEGEKPERKLKFVAVTLSKNIASASADLGPCVFATNLGASFSSEKKLGIGVSTGISESYDVTENTTLSWDIVGQAGTSSDIHRPEFITATSGSAGIRIGRRISDFKDLYMGVSATLFPTVSDTMLTYRIGIKSRAMEKLQEEIKKRVEIWDKWKIEEELKNKTNPDLSNQNLRTKLEAFAINNNLTEKELGSKQNGEFYYRALNRYFRARGEFLTVALREDTTAPNGTEVEQIPSFYLDAVELSASQLGNFLFIGAGVSWFNTYNQMILRASNDPDFSMRQDILSIQQEFSGEENDIKEKVEDLFGKFPLIISEDSENSDDNWQAFSMIPTAHILDREFIFRLDQNLKEKMQITEGNGCVILKVKKDAKFSIHAWDHMTTKILDDPQDSEDIEHIISISDQHIRHPLEDVKPENQVILRQNCSGLPNGTHSVEALTAKTGYSEQDAKRAEETTAVLSYTDYRLVVSQLKLAEQRTLSKQKLELKDKDKLTPVQRSALSAEIAERFATLVAQSSTTEDKQIANEISRYIANFYAESPTLYTLEADKDFPSALASLGDIVVSTSEAVATKAETTIEVEKTINFNVLQQSTTFISACHENGKKIAKDLGITEGLEVDSTGRGQKAIKDIQRVLNDLNITDNQGNVLATDGLAGPRTIQALQKAMNDSAKKQEFLEKLGIASKTTVALAKETKTQTQTLRDLWPSLSYKEKSALLTTIVANNLMRTNHKAEDVPKNIDNAQRYLNTTFEETMKGSVSNGWEISEYDPKTDYKALKAKSLQQLAQEKSQGNFDTVNLKEHQGLLVQMGASFKAQASESDKRFLQRFYLEENNNSEVFGYQTIENNPRLWLSTIPRESVLNTIKAIYANAEGMLGLNSHYKIKALDGQEAINEFQKAVLSGNAIGEGGFKQADFNIAEIVYKDGTNTNPPSHIKGSATYAPNVGMGFVKSLNGKDACDNPVVLSGPPLISGSIHISKPKEESHEVEGHSMASRTHHEQSLGTHQEIGQERHAFGIVVGMNEKPNATIVEVKENLTEEKTVIKIPPPKGNPDDPIDIPPPKDNPDDPIVIPPPKDNPDDPIVIPPPVVEVPDTPPPPIDITPPKDIPDNPIVIPPPVEVVPDTPPPPPNIPPPPPPGQR